MVNSFKNAKGQERVWHSYEQMVEQWPIPLKEIDVPTTYGLTHVSLLVKRVIHLYYCFMVLAITRRSCGS
ncbi:hypothetical protein [Paenibacillus pseudetheri]|uniref:Uncharacterized protein n=1 Tax=Paenibacillus pseudetheri TaxID=2897682 RepID=A0ABM9BCI1_9BACL|nr:hypothetical protein [Paenibacillus pseudetheri]CAH1056097.1 hypothetical protein PAECIP111894_02250 [Paenibacillus pseudetheri]